MIRRVWITNGLLAVGAALLIATVFLPIVCFFVFLGGSLVGGCASLWDMSPACGLLIVGLIVAGAGAAIRYPGDDQPSVVLTTGLFLAGVCVLGCFVLLSGLLIIHPYALAALLGAAIVFAIAAFVSKRPGRPVRIRFHLRTLLLCITVTAIALAAVRASL